MSIFLCLLVVVVGTFDVLTFMIQLILLQREVDFKGRMNPYQYDRPAVINLHYGMIVF